MTPPEAIHLAVDLGAGSGRVMAVVRRDEGLDIEPVDRFESPPVVRPTGLFWDLEGIWEHILTGLSRACEIYGAEVIRSIGVDSWGVDYGWIGEDRSLIGMPHSYRDSRTDGVMERVGEALGRDFIFGETGIQFMPINTLYQLHADLRADSAGQGNRRCFLMIADLINLRLTGRAVCERTNASTTQLYNPRTRNWSSRLPAAIGLPDSALPPLVDPGTVLGSLQPGVAAATGLPEVPVVAVGSHDTASAVAAVPATRPDFAYLSCGTWALLGVERSEPLINADVLEYNFTNETGVADTFRLLKNIAGLWLIQECRRAWQETDGRAIGYAELTDLAETAAPATAFVDPDWPGFAHPSDMPQAIRDRCRQTGQRVPAGRGEVLRVAVESLALKAAVVLDQLARLTGKPPDVVHVVGGGVRNFLLMRSLANAIGSPVVAGPVEATALGNALVQMMALGDLPSLSAGRALVARFLPVVRFEPDPSSQLSKGDRQRFESLLST